MSTLLIRLEGPMQSWGNTRGGVQPVRGLVAPSGFGVRPTQTVPTKSGVLGLAAAALGIDRAQSVEHLRALRFGVRVDRAGVPQTDLQTAHYGGEHPAVAAHVFLSDASFLVALEGDTTLLSALYAALKNPHWPLSLGRKAYLPSAPLFAPGPPVEDALALALSRHPLPERPDEVIRYAAETAAVPEDAHAVDYPGWDEPSAPFVLRRFQSVEAATWEGLPGQVFGWVEPAPAPRPAARAAAPRRVVDRQAVRSVQEGTKTEWTEAEARAEGLPLYYAAGWFRGELDRLGSLAAMAREHGYSNQALSKWAARHGLTLRPRLDETLRARVLALRAQGRSFAQIAAELSVSKASAVRLAH